MNSTKMLYYARIEVSEAIDVNKTSESKGCNISHYFLDRVFTFQWNVCNECHDLSMMSTYLNDIAILNIEGSDYWCIISRISKSEAINLMQNTNLTEKKGWIIKHNLLSHIRMGKELLMVGDIEIKNK